jgi:phosphatidate cytidylyltransferase
VAEPTSERTPEAEFPPPTAKHARSLFAAVISALTLLFLIVLFNLLGEGAFFFLAAAVVLIALFELFDALTQTGRKPNTVFGLLCGLALMAAAYRERTDLMLAVIAITTYGALLLSLRRDRGQKASSDAAWTVLGVIWIAGGGAGAVAMLPLSTDGSLILTAAILIVALSDIGAYFFGTAFGKHKLAPTISPAKSWEGLAGGFVATIAGGVLFGAMIYDLSLLQGISMGLIAGALAPLGDLVQSLAKRQIGIKDSGRLLPGHGGLWDRLDAILFTTPIIYLYLKLIVF